MATNNNTDMATNNNTDTAKDPRIAQTPGLDWYVKTAAKRTLYRTWVEAVNAANRAQ